MSAETLHTIQQAILAHLKDRNEPGLDIILNDWTVAYGGMVPSEGPGGIGHFTGYVTGPESTPQSSVGIMTMALDQLRAELINGCQCDDAEQ